MPHDGLTPTGAEKVGIESPVSVVGEERSSYDGSNSFGSKQADGDRIPDDKRDYTKDN